MNQLKIIFLLMLSSLLTFGQEFSNDHNIDSEDLINIFKEQGINFFKFPFELEKGEYISISYKIYEYGKLIEQRNVIEDFQKENDLQFNHHHSRKDSTTFHRLYFIKERDSLKMKQVLPGFTTFQKIDISKVAISDFAARTNVDVSLTNKREILFYYALYNNSAKLKENGGWLSCPTGKSNDKLINSYDMLILFFAERISAERAKSILGEGFYNNISCPIPINKE
ncbi:hypothetical protein GSB9_02073 [Flavobacteriaceae bacterium GSB9]|nr:hypothetical protein GSB9_02073 [Flavobacteriaceae bacterium GSB9]